VFDCYAVGRSVSVSSFACSGINDMGSEVKPIYSYVHRITHRKFDRWNELGLLNGVRRH